ncbi:hypothetical protein ACOSQ2_010175 [Xanthoceras sorbifolium]
MKSLIFILTSCRLPSSNLSSLVEVVLFDSDLGFALFDGDLGFVNLLEVRLFQFKGLRFLGFLVARFEGRLGPHPLAFYKEGIEPPLGFSEGGVNITGVREGFEPHPLVFYGEGAKPSLGFAKDAESLIY